MDKYHFVIADVFTDELFGGNQLAVFVDARGMTENEMHKLANEMNHLETTFLFPSDRPNCDCRVRIFTPTREVPFAGHPLVGTGYVIGSRNLIGLHGRVKRVNLDTEVGVVPIDLEIHNGQIQRSTMTQKKPQFLRAVESQSLVAEALGLPVEEIAKTGLPIEVVSTGLPVMIVPANSLAGVRNLKVNVETLSDISEDVGTATVLVYTRETVQPHAHVHCRVFAPTAGVLEDAATGSANGPLGCYLVKHNVISSPAGTRIVSEQGFEMNRPSTLYLDIEGQGENISSVRVGGGVVIVAEGEMSVERKSETAEVRIPHSQKAVPSSQSLSC